MDTHAELAGFCVYNFLGGHKAGLGLQRNSVAGLVGFAVSAPFMVQSQKRLDISEGCSDGGDKKHVCPWILNLEKTPRMLMEPRTRVCMC